MARKAQNSRNSALPFDAITIEGALIAPAMFAQIATLKTDLNQKPADYGVPKGLEIRDEIARYFRIGQALFKDFAAVKEPSPRATTDFVLRLLHDVFGFSDITRTEPKLVDERNHPITLESGGGRVPVVVVPPADPLERASEQLSRDGRRRSAASCLQDWLNVEDAALWGMAANGDRIRLMRDNASLTRPAYIEADLRHIFSDEAFSDFSALWLLIHATRFGKSGTPATDCTLERWRDAGAKEGEAARDRLRTGVEDAILAFGNGFLHHPDNAALRDHLGDGSLTRTALFEQLLQLIYRLIFLFAAEDRDLLHLPTASTVVRTLYADGYSLRRLRDRAALRRYRDSYHDQWEGLLIVFAALGSGEPRLGLPALGGLFAPGALPDLEVAKLANRDLMQAIHALAWLKGDGAPLPVNWRDMQTEELGSVYESLLELTPQITNDGRSFQFAEGGEAKGNARKTSGSYYTPDSLVQALLDSALDPVLDRVTGEASDPAQALLSVTVIDPACGSGHFLLAAARRIATRVAKVRAGDLAGAEDFRHALRDVVRACIYGVDRNPMAVELAKVALWIETVDPGKPLGFLDANIRCGDALFGVFELKALEKGIPDAAYKPLAGDDKATAKYYAQRNKDERGGQGRLDFAGGASKLPPSKPLADAARAIRSLPEDSTEEIVAKRKHFEAGRADAKSWSIRTACDLYTAAFLSRKTGGEPENRNAVTIPTTAHVWDALAGRAVFGPLVGRAKELSGITCAFHWPLEFPDLMASGGFDAVLGNPPWERIKLQEQEFFASRDPEIADAPNAAARGKLIAALANAAPDTRERALYSEFEAAKRSAEAASEFARVDAEEGGRFPLTGRGDVNTYALFAELFAFLMSSRGRAGVIVPTGIATDATTALFFGDLIAKQRLAQLLDFENRGGLFPAIDSRMKFCLLTLARDVPAASFAFFATDPAQLFDARRRFTLTPEEIARINPNTKTAPVFRSKADAELTSKIYSRIPVLIDETKGNAGNPWNASFFTRIWHMAEDSEWFRTSSQLAEAGFVQNGADWLPEKVVQSASHSGRDDERYVPLYEAKMIHQFDHRWATYDRTDGGILSGEKRRSPTFEAQPRYWVPFKEVEARLDSKGWRRNWLMGWRKISRATDERSLIATVFPRAAAGDSFPLCLPNCGAAEVACLLACLCSLVVDFCERQKLGGTNLTFQYLFQLAILPPSGYAAEDISFLASRVLELSYTSHSMVSFAQDLGYDGPPFKWDEGRRALLRAELDAWYARAYGLTRDELRYILDPADVMGADYPSETFRVLKNNEIAKHGEYRTRRLVLDAWDRLEQGELV